jgi:hypothetical protein
MSQYNPEKNGVHLRQISICHDPAILLREKTLYEMKSVSDSALTPFVRLPCENMIAECRLIK